MTLLRTRKDSSSVDEPLLVFYVSFRLFTGLQKVQTICFINVQFGLKVEKSNSDVRSLHAAIGEDTSPHQGAVDEDGQFALTISFNHHNQNCEFE